MAKIELTTAEALIIAAPRIPNEIEDLTATDKGFEFMIKLNHGIPLLPSSIPIKLNYAANDKEHLIFEISLNQPNKIINKVVTKITELLSLQINKKFPEGISMNGKNIYMQLNLLTADNIKITEIKNAEMKEGLFYLEFEVE